MGVFEKIKNIWNIPEEEDYLDENIVEDTEEAPKRKIIEAEQPASRTVARSFGKSNKTVPFNPTQMQVVIFKPDRFDEVIAIADELNAKKTVILNLESANREVSRRITDFLSGVAYANSGDFKKVANNTFMIVPYNVDVSGELVIDEFDDGKLYY